jgi:hypothetical protein
MATQNSPIGRNGFTGLLLLLLSSVSLPAAQTPSEPKSVPRMQAVPMPYHQASFQRDGVELARYHFGPALHRPFLFPVIGPSGRSLTLSYGLYIHSGIKPAEAINATWQRFTKIRPADG